MCEEERRIAEKTAQDPNQQTAKTVHDRRIRHEIKGRRAQVALQEQRHRTGTPPSTLSPPARPSRPSRDRD